jgi:hypothetical protein
MENVPQWSRVYNYVQNELKWQGVALFLCHERSSSISITACLNISVYNNSIKYIKYAIYYRLLYFWLHYGVKYFSIKCCISSILFAIRGQWSNTRTTKNFKVLMFMLLRRVQVISEKRLISPPCPFVCQNVSALIPHCLFSLQFETEDLYQNL